MRSFIHSPEQNMGSDEVPYSNVGPAFIPSSPTYQNASETSTPFIVPRPSDEIPKQTKYPNDLQFIFMDMSREEQMELLKKPEQEQIQTLKEIADKKLETDKILNVEENYKKEQDSQEKESGEISETNSGGSIDNKKIIITNSETDNNTNNESNNRKIIF